MKHVIKKVKELFSKQSVQTENRTVSKKELEEATRYVVKNFGRAIVKLSER